MSSEAARLVSTRGTGNGYDERVANITSAHNHERERERDRAPRGEADFAGTISCMLR
jgi:hypothetical protein